MVSLASSLVGFFGVRGVLGLSTAILGGGLGAGVDVFFGPAFGFVF